MSVEDRLVLIEVAIERGSEAQAELAATVKTLTNGVSTMFADWPALLTTFGSMGKRLDVLETRVDSLGRSVPISIIPPSEARFDRSKSGRHIIVEVHGKKVPVDASVVEVLRKEIFSQIGKSATTSLLTLGRWTGKHVAASLVLAIVVYYLGSRFGIHLQP